MRIGDVRQDSTFYEIAIKIYYRPTLMMSQNLLFRGIIEKTDGQFQIVYPERFKLKFEVKNYSYLEAIILEFMYDDDIRNKYKLTTIQLILPTPPPK